MFDLTQPLLHGRVPCYPGDPEFSCESLTEFAPWQMSRITMSSHNGTHMDAARHRVPGGKGIGDYGPERLLGSGIVIDATGFAEDEAMPASVLAPALDAITPGSFVLLRTGWDAHWTDDRYFRHPFISPQLAEALVAQNIGLVAIDALNVDSTVAGAAAAHEIILGADVLIAENLRGLSALRPGTRYQVACFPLSLGPADGSPARIIAWEPGELG